MITPSFRLKDGAPLRQGGRVVNAMSVDVEEWFQVQALSGAVGRDAWDRLPSRVERSTEAVLALFAEAGVSATFFVLAWVAERHRALVRRIVAEGHELASHGTEHCRADSQGLAEFRADVGRSRRVLEDIGGVRVRGYRAPTFSIGPANLWAFEALAAEGYAYSSSVYPLARELCGLPGAPRFAFDTGMGVEEYPVATVRLGKRLFPCGGGGFFRLLPYGASRAALRRVNEADGRPAVFYLHPWELDSGQPRVKGLSPKARFRHRVNLGRTEARLKRLARDFVWDRIDKVFA